MLEGEHEELQALLKKIPPR